MDDGIPRGAAQTRFHDLIDSNNEGGDETTCSADYVTDVLRTCHVNGSNKRDDVADFVWCLENRVNEDVHNDSTWLKSLER